MTIEEKAKAYDEVLEKATALYKAAEPMSGCNVLIETLFPKLKESEDERIRNFLIDFIKVCSWTEKKNQGWPLREECIAWLERQGKQKIDDDDKVILENWEGIVKDNKEKWQLSDWFVEATLSLVQKIEQIGLPKSIVDNNKTMLNACINTLRNVGHSHLAAWLEKQYKQKTSEEITSNPDYISPKDKALFKIATVLSQHEDKNGSPLEEIRSILVDYGINNLESNEQKSADNVAPKFHEGEWVVNDTTFNLCHILKVEHGQYVCDDCSFPITKENEYHLWTIQDAKEGDVLVCESGWTCIFKTLVNDETFSSYCFMDDTKWFCETGSECHTLKEEFVKAYNGKIHLATKEQRDLLFQKMKDAGYEWDTEKKELLKIEQKSLDSSFEIKPKFKFGDIIREKKTGNLFLVNSIEDFGYTLHYKNCNANGCTMSFKYEDDYELVEQNPIRWSDKDETILNSCISILKTSDGYETLNSNWLKSLKYRVQPQLKQEWSYEDENRLSSLLFLLHEYNNYNFDDWLKLLKNRVQPK